ncbi:hypothetical protein BMW22_27735 (plasmid) [Rhizobium leguminosarum]|uniref:ABC transmembrane type-1 domain-containing protein n=1 Tax=Rhizobium leguminosarum TaxID=384 RepID=A0A1L3ZKG9_RHILE|nr:ABC transporter permease [Rhizobium laguerreae]API56070.1 hypothetical protein BMW22_27735 [Rhizobium leguminosarum]
MLSSIRTIPASDATFAASLAILAALAVLSAGASYIAPSGINDQDLLRRLLPPMSQSGGATFLLGTDTLGRGIFSRMLYSMQTSLLIGIIGTFLGAMVGSAVGLFAAHFGGIVEEIVLGLIDVQSSIPFLIIALTALAIFGGGIATFIVIIGLHGWETYARLVRGAVKSALNMDFVVALRITGAGATRIYVRHLLPSIIGIIIAQMTLTFPGVVLLESGLSFLGMGVQPPGASLGLMVSEGRAAIMTQPWLCLAPGLLICLLCLLIAQIGDRLGDKFSIAKH